jgi:glutamyl-tRNA reductase
MAADIFDFLKVNHWRGQGPNATLPPSSESSSLWLQTCLRTVAIARETQGSAESSTCSSHESFRDSEAYRFLLQMACGLHSPIVGETEVAGQVREAFARFSHPEHRSWYVRLHSILSEDMKRVRERHLIGLGSQSYGSYVRRELGRAAEIEILGAGPLAQEVTTWLLKPKDPTEVSSPRLVRIRVREMLRARQKAGWAFGDKAQAAGLLVESMAAPSSDRAAGPLGLVVAAPLSNADLDRWLLQAYPVPGQRERLTVIDLRGGLEPGEERLAERIKIERSIDLAQVFSEISRVQEEAHIKKSKALAYIDELVERRVRSMSVRPFGWDDVCG